MAREKVRVARALGRLPVVHAAFAAGQLSYCKVRALSRVATETTEAELLEIARGATGAQLETVVRSWRRIMVGETAASAHARRGVRRRVEDDGAVVYTTRVSPEEAPVIDAALAAARLVVLDENGRPVETAEEAVLADAVTDDPPAVRSEADAMLLLAESFLATGARGEVGEATLVLVHADLDALADACRTAADRSAPIAGSVSAETSRQDVVDVSAETSQPDGADVSAEPSQTDEAADPRPVEPLPEGGSVHQASMARRPPGCTGQDGQPISAATVMRMLCQSPAQLLVTARDGRPLDLGRTSRNADRRQRRALRVRDGDFCRFPGCTQRHRLIPHHTWWWSRGGPTDLDLLVLLCPTHHRAVHELGYQVHAIGTGRIAWYRPDGRPIPVSPSGELLLEPDQSDPATGTVVLAAAAITPTWGGEHIDLDHLLGGLAANLLIRDGHKPADIPNADLDATLRHAARWPAVDPATPGPFDPPAAAA